MKFEGVIEMPEEAVSWLYQSLEERKKHLPSQLKYDFVFNKKSLSDDEKREVESHIHECRVCAAEITDFEENYEMYSNLPDLELLV